MLQNKRILYIYLAIAALLKHIGRSPVKIGVGGALIQFHPTYHSLLEAQLNTLAPLHIQVVILI